MNRDMGRRLWIRAVLILIFVAVAVAASVAWWAIQVLKP